MTYGRFLIFWLTNNHLLDKFEVLKPIYYTLINNQQFINFCPVRGRIQNNNFIGYH